MLTSSTTSRLVGGRKLEQLQDNIKAVSIKLSDAQMTELDKVVPFDYGFPYDMTGQDPHWIDGTSCGIRMPVAKIDFVKTLVPAQLE